MAKHRTGYLFKRGKTFYVSWRIEGKAFAKALHDDNGNPITTRREAEEAKQKIMAPFVVADEAAALESIVGKLEGRKAELAKLENEQNPPLSISRAWTEFVSSANRPDSGESTLVWPSMSLTSTRSGPIDVLGGWNNLRLVLSVEGAWPASCEIDVPLGGRPGRMRR